MKSIFNILIVASTLFIISCKQTINPNNCEKVMCTMEYRMITIQLQDSIGNDFVPDKVETYNESNTLINSATTSIIPNENSYILIDDGNKNDIGLNTNYTVMCKVYKNGGVVKEEQFIVRADCCHVSKISGNTIIVIP